MNQFGPDQFWTLGLALFLNGWVFIGASRFFAWSPVVRTRYLAEGVSMAGSVNVVIGGAQMLAAIFLS